MPSSVDWPVAVAVVEHVLGQRVVHGDDRIGQHAVALHRPQANDAGRRLFAAADQLAELIRVLGEDRRDQIAAVVHRDLRVRGDHRLDVRVVGRVVFALDRVGGDAVLAERRRDVVLRRQRIARAERDRRTAGLQREHQVRGLGGDVQARADAHAVAAASPSETVANLCRAPACSRPPTRSSIGQLSARPRSLTFLPSTARGSIQKGHSLLTPAGDEKRLAGLSPQATPNPSANQNRVATIDDYLRRLASSDPVPGGGSAAALAGALGAALAAMVGRIRLTADRRARRARRSPARRARRRTPSRRNRLRRRRRGAGTAQARRRRARRASKRPSSVRYTPPRRRPCTRLAGAGRARAHRPARRSAAWCARERRRLRRRVRASHPSRRARTTCASTIATCATRRRSHEQASLLAAVEEEASRILARVRAAL